MHTHLPQPSRKNTNLQGGLSSPRLPRRRGTTTCGGRKRRDCLPRCATRTYESYSRRLYCCGRCGLPELHAAVLHRASLRHQRVKQSDGAPSPRPESRAICAQHMPNARRALCTGRIACARCPKTVGREAECPVCAFSLRRPPRRCPTGRFRIKMCNGQEKTSERRTAESKRTCVRSTAFSQLCGYPQVTVCSA